VKAYWEFEEGSHWLGFSPKVSVLLEAAYQNWLQNPSEVRSQIHGKDFLYNVDYTTLLEEGQRQSQRIRRVGVTADESEHDKAYCTVDPSLWRDMQNKLQSFREEQEWLLRLLRSDYSATAPEKDGFYGALAEEVGRLWHKCGRQAAELDLLRSEVQRSSQLLERLRSAVLPGRLVCSADFQGIAAAVEREMVHISREIRGHEDHEQLVVPKAELRRAPCGLLARPGTKVFFPHEGGRSEGVVSVGSIAPLEGDGLNVSVLRADGKCCWMPLASLEPRDAGSQDHPFSVGNVVQACEHDSFAGVDGPPAGTYGIVMRVCEDLSSKMDSISVRFPDAKSNAGFRDVCYTDAQAKEQLQVDEEVDRIRPGVAVRLRSSVNGQGRKHETGVVFSLHGNGIAVVDFLGNWGFECPTFDLEMVEDPFAMEVEIISTLSECLTWEELFNASNHLTLGE